MKILIFYGSYGGGHLSAARSIKDYIDLNYDNNEIKLVDCIELVSKTVNKISTNAYTELAKKAPKLWGTIYNRSQKGNLAKLTYFSNKLMSVKIYKLIKEYSPDIIISTHPFGTQMSAFLKKSGKINCKIANVLTDYAPHEQWLKLSDFVDFYFVAHSKMKNMIIEKGIDAFKVFTTGIPLSNRFLESYDKANTLNSFGLVENKITILFFAGGEFGLGKNTTFKILESIINNFSNTQIIAIAGRNIKIKQQFDELVERTNSKDSVKILEFSDKIPELMSVSDLVITKPGGLTTTESLASRITYYCY